MDKCQGRYFSQSRNLFVNKKNYYSINSPFSDHSLKRFKGTIIMFELYNPPIMC